MVSMKIKCFDRQIIFVLALMFFSFEVQGSDQIPAPPQKHPIALTGGTIHTVGGEIIHNGIIIFDKGKITDMGSALTVPTDAVRVDIQSV